LIKKKRNVLLTETQQIKIGDFGTSIIAFDKTSTKWGTLEYMSPEMRNGKGHSFETDIWSAGCVLYELITLKRYFDQNESNNNSFIDNLNTKNVFKLLLNK
jgi:cell cycle serine/threonine-protein kinase CDC5/MSD2